LPLIILFSFSLSVWIRIKIACLLLFISSNTKVREVELEPVTIQLRWFHQFQFAGRNELAVQVDVFDTASQALLV